MKKIQKMTKTFKIIKKLWKFSFSSPETHKVGDY